MQKWAGHRNLMPTLMHSHPEGLRDRTGRDEKGPGPTHTKAGSDLPQVCGGHLSADWCRWFMGFPVGWLDDVDVPKSARSATRLSRNVRKSSGK